LDAIVPGRKALRINITKVKITNKGYTQMLNMNLADSKPAQTISVKCGEYDAEKK
jgi:hypothetical protein